jgi:hypothetical protein
MNLLKLGVIELGEVGGDLLHEFKRGWGSRGVL